MWKKNKLKIKFHQHLNEMKWSIKKTTKWRKVNITARCHNQFSSLNRIGNLFRIMFALNRNEGIICLNIESAKVTPSYFTTDVCCCCYCCSCLNYCCLLFHSISRALIFCFFRFLNHWHVFSLSLISLMKVYNLACIEKKKSRKLKSSFDLNI